MKQENNKQKYIKGFTLLEMLVVVLIIGILAGIALPQYQMAVTKAKVASILPLMRRWKDALTEYRLQHDAWLDGVSPSTYGEILGVTWPSDWKTDTNKPCNNNASCHNDYWKNCDVNDGGDGMITCYHNTSDGVFTIIFLSSEDEDYPDKLTCQAEGKEATKVCKALGGKLLEEYDEESGLYAI